MAVAAARKIEMHFKDWQNNESIISIPRVNPALSYTELQTIVTQRLASFSQDQVTPYLVETTRLDDLAKEGN